MKKTLEYILPVEYSQIFNEPAKLESILEGVGRNDVLGMSCFFLGLDRRNSEFQDVKGFLEKFFCSSNEKLANEIYNKILKIQKETNSEMTIPFTLTSLTLFEYAFSYLEKNSELSQEETEIRFFKAYLLVNESYSKRQKKFFKDFESMENNELSIAKAFFTLNYPISDFINYNPKRIMSTQLIKSVYLFEMLESDNLGKNLLDKFLQKYECTSWRDYINQFMPLILGEMNNKKEGYLDIELLNNNIEAYKKTKSFLEKHCLTPDEVLDNYEFQKTRARPMYLTEEGKYRIVTPLFLLELLYTGVYFKLLQINNKKKIISDFRRYMGKEFSEKYLLYKALDYIYKNKYITFTGEEMDKAGWIGGPDYYIRNGNKIFLIETKDVLIKSEIKGSFNLEKLESALTEKFYFFQNKTKKKRKSILQLIRNIEDVLSKAIKIDQNYNEKNVVIYPILVTHHRQFDTIGLNTIINSWFQKELINVGIENEKIRPITIINIDEFLYNSELFIQKKIQLEKLIEGYHKSRVFDRKKNYKNKTAKVESTFLPFEKYMDRQLKKKRLISNPRDMINEIKSKWNH